MKKEIKERLEYLRGEIEAERISYHEIAELQDYKKEIFELDDVIIAEWSGISEDDWNKRLIEYELKLAEL